MKIVQSLILCALCATALSGCAAGAATAGYALRAQSADGLTAEGEERIIAKTKREIMAELNTTKCGRDS